MPNSKLSRVIEEFGSGKRPASDVIAALPKPTGGTSRKLDELSDPPAAISEGTWDEVSFAYSLGRLTADQYQELYDLYGRELRPPKKAGG